MPSDFSVPPPASGTFAATPLPEPTVPTAVAGYDVGAPLGEGGMGKVYRATQRSLGRAVALKLLSPSATRDPNFMERFAREAKAAGALSHPNVVRVIDAGIDPLLAQPFIAYELVEGRDLGGVIRDALTLPERRALEIARDIARGLEQVHALGIVHRDLKPANVLVDGSGRAKIADLGLAKLESDAGGTTTGVVVGTPHYMSPEQAHGSNVGSKTDIYSLGLIIYKATTGRLAFPSTSSIGTLTMRVQEDCPDPREIVPALSGALVDLVLLLTTRDPDARPDAAATLAEIDRTIARPRKLARRASRSGIQIAASERDGSPTPRPAKGGPSVTIGLLGVGIVLLAAAAAGLLLVGTDLGDDGAAASTPVAAATGSSSAAVARPASTAGDDDDDDDDDPADPPVAPDPRPDPPPAPPVDPRQAFYAPAIHGKNLELVSVWGDCPWKHATMIAQVDISADGRRAMAVSLDGWVAAWDVATGEELFRDSVARSPTPAQVILGAAIRPDGRWVVVGDDEGRLHAWDLDREGARGPPSVPGHGSTIGAITFSRDDQRVYTGGADARCRDWTLDESTGAYTPHGTMTGKVPFRDLAMSGPPLERIAASAAAGSSGAADQNGVMLLAPQPPKIGVLSGRQLPTHAEGRVAISLDGRRVLVGADVDPGAGEPLAPRLFLDATKLEAGGIVLAGHRGARAVAFSPDGQLALTGDATNGFLLAWDLTADPLEARRLAGKHWLGWVQDVAVAHDGERLIAISGGNDTFVRRWDLDAGVEIDPPDVARTIVGVARGIEAAGETIATLGGAGCRIWRRDGATRELLEETFGRTLALAPDGRSVAIGTGDGRVAFRDLDEENPTADGRWSWFGRPAGQLADAKPSPVTALAVHRGRVVSGSAAGIVQGWDGRNAVSQILRRHEGSPILAIAPDPDGGVISISADGQVIQDGVRPSFRVETVSPILRATISRDARRLVTLSRAGVRIRDLVTGEEHAAFTLTEKGARAGQLGCALSPDGARLAITADRIISVLAIGDRRGELSSLGEVTLDLAGQFDVTGVCFDGPKAIRVTTAQGPLLHYVITE